MAIRNVYEILNDFKAATTNEERIQVLRENDTPALRNVLLGTFHPAVEFTVKKLPNYKKVEVPPGMSYSHIVEALRRAYLFQKGNTRVPEGLSEKRKTEILIQILEGLEPEEAKVFGGMIMRDLEVPYLTYSLVSETFPGLLPEVVAKSKKVEAE